MHALLGMITSAHNSNRVVSRAVLFVGPQTIPAVQTVQSLTESGVLQTVALFKSSPGIADTLRNLWISPFHSSCAAL